MLLSHLYRLMRGKSKALCKTGLEVAAGRLQSPFRRGRITRTLTSKIEASSSGYRAKKLLSISKYLKCAQDGFFNIGHISSRQFFLNVLPFPGRIFFVKRERQAIEGNSVNHIALNPLNNAFVWRRKCIEICNFVVIRFLRIGRSSAKRHDDAKLWGYV